MAKRTPFAVAKDGGLYVEVAAIMSPLIPFIDGIAVTYFGRRSKRAYLAVDDAIKWCQQEKEFHSREKYEQVIAALERFKAQESPVKDKE